MEWWNGGLMEYWVSEAEYIFILFIGLPNVLNKDLILLNPSFQRSNIPPFQGIRLKQRQATLTRPKAPGFQG
jgi:hypothetical protein